MIMQDNKKHLLASYQSVMLCSETLKKIATTCCMPERSSEMNQSLAILNELSMSLNKSSADEDLLKTYIKQIEELGRLLGKLYVSCCTDTREPMYQQIFKQLNRTHGHLFMAMGVSH